ncbi:IS630 family transposase [Streptomyces turgidiscabies]|uniref:IS630 family transposase n=1 Tax=Streptomyces turgidiscabies TaxID=85558 RepID=UPI0038F6C5BE
MGDARYLSPSAQEALRMRAVAALVEGRCREDVAAMLQVSPKTVAGWRAKWMSGGRETLMARPRGRRTGDHQLLSAAQQQRLRQAVLDYRPCDLGLAGQLWTRAQVGALIAVLYQERLTDQGTGKYLHRWGLSFERPDRRAAGQDAEALKAWREKAWPALRARARAEAAEVVLADQVGIRSGQANGRRWGESDRTPATHRSGISFSGSAMAAIGTKGLVHFMVVTGTFDGTVACDFLERLSGHFDRKVHLVVDAHPAYRSRAVNDWLAGHANRIELHFLPLRGVTSEEEPIRVEGQAHMSFLDVGEPAEPFLGSLRTPSGFPSDSKVARRVPRR